MKTYFLLTILCFSSLVAFSQKLELARASPFSAVKWEGDDPIVLFEDAWYHFEKLDHLSKEEIISFARKQFGHKWKKRFSEDLVEVLQGLGYQPNVDVKLLLSQDGVLKAHTGTFTFKNRQRSLDYNKAIKESQSTIKFPQIISKANALADVQQFEDILNKTSSYSQISSFDYTNALCQLSTAITSASNDVDVNKLTNELSKIMSEIGDRHSSIKNEAFQRNSHDTYNLKLPFGVAAVEGKVVAVKKDITNENYTYYDTAHPYIKSIDGTAIEMLLDSYNYRDKMALIQTKRSRGSRAIQNYGSLLFKNNLPCPDSVQVVLSNGTTDKSEIVGLTTENKVYFSSLLQEHYGNREQVSNGNFDSLSKLVGKNIGYILLPEMYHYDEVKGLESYLKKVIVRFSNTKALIIDVRNNPGGGREILRTFASYIVQAEQSPWIANVAYLRTDSIILGDEASMSARYLYPYNSDKFTGDDRKAIDQFTAQFELQNTVDPLKFSPPFYMVLHSGEQSYTQPVYILVNENSFSAATVFTSVFKGLPNVKIVGTTTDGSSGNSRELHLKHSNIRVKVSTMLSFQRNGKTLDGNGTEPDIIMHADERQVLESFDRQLSKLIEEINRG